MSQDKDDPTVLSIPVPNVKELEDQRWELSVMLGHQVSDQTTRELAEEYCALAESRLSKIATFFEPPLKALSGLKGWLSQYHDPKVKEAKEVMAWNRKQIAQYLAEQQAKFTQERELARQQYFKQLEEHKAMPAWAAAPEPDLPTPVAPPPPTGNMNLRNCAYKGRVTDLSAFYRFLSDNIKHHPELETWAAPADPVMNRLAQYHKTHLSRLYPFLESFRPVTVVKTRT